MAHKGDVKDVDIKTASHGMLEPHKWESSKRLAGLGAVGKGDGKRVDNRDGRTNSYSQKRRQSFGD